MIYERQFLPLLAVTIVLRRLSIPLPATPALLNRRFAVQWMESSMSEVKTEVIRKFDSVKPISRKSSRRPQIYLTPAWVGAVF